MRSDFAVRLQPHTLSLAYTLIRIYTGAVFDVHGQPICTATGIMPRYYSYMIPILAFEFFLFLLSFRIVVIHIIDAHGNGRRALEYQSILKVILRDSILYYIVYVSLSVPQLQNN
jgi:hypothetical protein